MKSKAKLLLLVPMLLTVSCVQQPRARVQLTKPSMPNSSANFRTSSATEKFAPCSSLVLGKVSTQDTTGTLGWLLPLMKTIEASCGK